MTEARIKVVVQNRRARHDYYIEDRYEAGMVLMGSEVKSMRAGKVSLQEAYCLVQGGEVFLVNAHIAPYASARYFGHEPRRKRKLLLNHREIRKLRKATEQKGYTLIPLKIYLKDGKFKLELGLGKGKQTQDKRHAIADRENKRQLDRIKRHKNR